MLCSLRRVLVASSLVLLAGSAAAQDATLDNVWFKLKIRIKGEAAVPGTEKPHKTSIAVTAYLHLTMQDPADSPTDGAPTYGTTTYNYELWTESSPDTWTISDGSSIGLETADATVFYLPDLGLEVNTLDGASIDCYQTIAIRAKLDGEGALKSATLKTLGGEVHEGTTDGTDAIRGGISMTGKTIAVDDLPFPLG